MAYVLYRGEYDKRKRQGEAGHAGRAAADAGGLAAQPARLRAVAAAAGESADGARDGQSLLAGGFRHRHRPHDRTTSASPAKCRPIPNCSTGWPSSSARSGWDMKRFFKLLVTSATYRQAATGDAGKAGEGPGQSAAVARPALPHGRRNDPRLRPGGQRIAGAEDRRAERQAVSAARAFGKRWP